METQHDMSGGNHKFIKWVKVRTINTVYRNEYISDLYAPDLSNSDTIIILFQQAELITQHAYIRV